MILVVRQTEVILKQTQRLSKRHLIPGRALVGIELPNRSIEFVTLKKMMEADILKNAKSKLTVALGLDVSGKPVVADIARMPHVLIAGSTGSGTTVVLNLLTVRWCLS